MLRSGVSGCDERAALGWIANANGEIGKKKNRVVVVVVVHRREMTRRIFQKSRRTTRLRS